jgi:hypothetical protein
MSLIKRCKVCNRIIGDDEDLIEGKDDPELCELCNAAYVKEKA